MDLKVPFYGLFLICIILVVEASPIETSGSSQVHEVLTRTRREKPLYTATEGLATTGGATVAGIGVGAAFGGPPGALLGAFLGWATGTVYNLIRVIEVSKQFDD
ncbi:unnamed protein product [Colias eurytheme]|nr:unnamed protein product [Colias eurytheme]